MLVLWAVVASVSAFTMTCAFALRLFAARLFIDLVGAGVGGRAKACLWVSLACWVNGLRWRGWW